MKKTIIIIVSVLAALLIAGAAVFFFFFSGTGSGTCGENVEWNLKDGILTVSGTGKTADYSSEQPPWNLKKHYIKSVVVEEGITNIGNQTFHHLDNLETVLLPSTLKSIGDNAFSECEKLSAVNLPGKVVITDTSFRDTPSLSPITITAQPVSTNVEKSGDTAIVNITATGKDLTYRWLYQNRNAEDWSESSIHEPEYSVRMNDTRYGRKLYCELTDKYARKLNSDIVTLTFNTELYYIQQPEDTMVAARGDTATLTAQAYGKGVSYEWYFRNSGDTEWKKSVSETNTFSTKVTKKRYGREVYCVATDTYGNSIISDHVRVTFDTGLRIVQQPTDVIVAYAGDEATLKVVAEGKGKSYEWYYKNPDMKSFAKSKKKSSTYTIIVNEKRDGRQVYCVVTDKYGAQVQSEVVTLSIKK